MGQTNTSSASKNLAVGGLVQNFGNYFSSFGATTLVQGTASSDNLIFGTKAAHEAGQITIQGNGGDDEIHFGDSAAYDAGSSITIFGGQQSEDIRFGNYAGVAGEIMINAYDGDLNLYAGGGTKLFDISHGDGRFYAQFGYDSGGGGGGIEDRIKITSGDGEKFIHSASYLANYGSFNASFGNGPINVNLADKIGTNGKFSLIAGHSDQGVHGIFVGDNAGEKTGSFSLELGNGNHDIRFDEYAAVNEGTVSLKLGDGDQYINFGKYAGYHGTINIVTGSGNSQFIFGDLAAYGNDTNKPAQITVMAGVGEDFFSFGDHASITTGVSAITLDLGSDTDPDSVSFGGLVGKIFIQNYSVTYDDKVDVVVPSTWSGTDDGTDIVFTQSDQTITFEGLGGVGGSTDPLDYFM